MPVSARVRLPAAYLAAAVVALPMAFAGPPPALAQSTPPTKAQPKPAAPQSVVDRAAALLRAGRPVRALAILRPAVEARRGDLTLLFLVGRAGIAAASRQGLDAASRTAFLDAAIAALRRMLVIRPGLMRARLELARAFFLKGEDRLARRHFEQVLAGEPPAGVALNVNRFLSAMRARKRWSVRVGAALLPDTNIGAGSDERTIYIPVGGQLLPFQRDQEELTTSGIGISAWLGGEYQYPLSQRWRLRTGGDIARKEYKTSEFDRMTVSGHVGPRWLIGRASEVSLLLSGLHEWAGSGIEEPSHYDIGFRVEAGHRLNRRTTMNARVSRHERRYDASEHRDGPIADVSVGLGWVASPTLRIDAGLGWSRLRTELERFRNDGRRVSLGASAALPWGFTVGGSGTLRWTEYEGNWFPQTLDGSPRSDLTRTIRLFAHNRALTLEGFSPQVSVTQELRTSNAQLYGYDRIFGELRFVRLF